MLGGGSILQKVSDVSIVSDYSFFFFFPSFPEQQQNNQKNGKMLNFPYKKVTLAIKKPTRVQDTHMMYSTAVSSED